MTDAKEERRRDCSDAWTFAGLLKWSGVVCGKWQLRRRVIGRVVLRWMMARKGRIMNGSYRFCGTADE